MEHIEATSVIKSKPTLNNVCETPVLLNGKSEPANCDEKEYDPIYDIAIQFATTHGYSFVVFEDDQIKRIRKTTQRHHTISPRCSERKPRNAMLPRGPTEHDRKAPVHAVRYAANIGNRCRRRCHDETSLVLESVVNDMKLIESAKKDIDMVKIVNSNLSKLDVILPGTEKPSPTLSFKQQKTQKRRSSSRSSRFISGISPNRTSASSTLKASVSQQSLESPRDDCKGIVRVSNTTEAILSSAPLEDFKEYLSDMCVKIFQDQPDLSPSAEKPITEAPSIRTTAEGDIGAAEGGTCALEKSPNLGACPSPGRPANLKLKSKKSDSQNFEFLKKYYARQVKKSEENQSLNNAPNDETGASNLMPTDVLGKDEIDSSILGTPSPRQQRDHKPNLYRVCNSISDTVFHETILALKSTWNPCGISTLPVAKIDFVRVKNKSLKMKSLTMIGDQDIYQSLGRHLHHVPRTLKFSCSIIRSPPITRIRCNPHLRLGKPRAYSEYPCCVHTIESCHNFSLYQSGSARKMSGTLTPSNAQRESCFPMHSEALGETRQLDSDPAADNSKETKKDFGARDMICAPEAGLSLPEPILSGVLDEPKGDKQDLQVSSLTVDPADSPAQCHGVDGKTEVNELQKN
ncbi:hypothetical protein BgiMline_028491 [Biomphalaria glabrata]|nr:hypothetical protein BgiMline_014288 [Biomphalaria glabrata]